MRFQPTIRLASDIDRHWLAGLLQHGAVIGPRAGLPSVQRPSLTGSRARFDGCSTYLGTLLHLSDHQSFAVALAGPVTSSRKRSLPESATPRKGCVSLPQTSSIDCLLVATPAGLSLATLRTNSHSNECSRPAGHVTAEDLQPSNMYVRFVSYAFILIHFFCGTVTSFLALLPVLSPLQAPTLLPLPTLPSITYLVTTTSTSPYRSLIAGFPPR